MISLKNNILRIEKGNMDSFLRRLYEISFFLGIIMYYLFDAVLHYIGVGFFVLGAVIITFNKIINSKINIPINSIWYLGFLIFAEISSSWAYSASFAAYKYIKFMLMILFVCFGMVQYSDTKDDTEKLSSIYLLASSTILIVLLIVTPFDNWFAGYFGTALGGDNSNTFGYIMFTSILLSFYKAYLKNQRLYYILTVLYIFGVAISSSRKSSFLALFGIMFIIFFAFRKKHHFIHFIVALIGCLIAVYSLFRVELLYDMIGFRFEKLFDFLQDNTSAGEFQSLQKRQFMIEYAKILFKNHPVLGCGFGNFTVLIDLEPQMDLSYAHNNYWEILADLGVTGFVIYYWFYLYLFVSFIIKFFRKQFNNMTLLAFTLLICEVIAEWGTVSMAFPFCQLTIAFIYLYFSTDNTASRKKFYYTEKSDLNNI